jgi:hypothetical protein
MQLSSSLALLVSLAAVSATYGRYARDAYAADLYARDYGYDSLYAREADTSDLYARDYGYDSLYAREADASDLYARDVYERDAYDDGELYARDAWAGLETRDAEASLPFGLLKKEEKLGWLEQQYKDERDKYKNIGGKQGVCQWAGSGTCPVSLRLMDLCVWRCANAVRRR